MALPYSHRFIGGSIPAGGNLQYAVPAGVVGIIRNIDIVNNATGPISAFALINGSWYLYQWSQVPQFTAVDWQGRQVLNAGDTLEIGAVGGNVHTTVSGYLLTLPP